MARMNTDFLTRNAECGVRNVPGAKLFCCCLSKRLGSEVVESGGGLPTHPSVRVIERPGQSGQARAAVGVAIVRGRHTLNGVDGVNNLDAVGLVYVSEGVRQCRNCRTTNLTKSVC